MGHHHSKDSISQDKYFKEARLKQLNFLANVDGYLENTSEWISIFKKFLKENKSEWSRSLLKTLKYWEHFQDLSSKVAFAWNRYNSLKMIPKVDQENMCLWRDSIMNLETFSFEVDKCPFKRTLHKFLTTQKDCTLSRIILEFKKCLVNCYVCRENGKITLKSDTQPDLPQLCLEIDKAIQDFCSVMLEVIPKFFLDIPESIGDMNSIIRDSVVSDEVLSLLIMMRRETRSIDHYLQALQHFSSCRLNSKISFRLENETNKHFSSAIEHLVGITHSSSIGEMQDSIALFMNQVSRSLYEPLNPEKVVEDDDIIEAFLVVIIRASAPDLPYYIDIISKFMDENTVTKKDVGKGVTKLIYLIEEIDSWKDLIDIKY